MSTRPYEGNTFAYYVPSIADESAPTVAEIEAGVALEPGMTAGGLTPSHTENMVSTPMMRGFIRQNIGTEGITFDLQFIYDPDTTETDDIWTNFDTRAKAGYLVVAEADAASGVDCDVYPATFGRRKRVASSQDTDKMFTVKVACNADYTDDATIAA